MGGDSSSSSKTETSSSTTVTDQRTVADGGAIVLGNQSNGNVITSTTTDHGAIAGAFNVAGVAADIANKAVLGATALATQASEQQGKVSTAAFNLADKTAETIKGAFTVAADSAQGNRTLALAGLTLAAVLGISLAIRKN